MESSDEDQVQIKRRKKTATNELEELEKRTDGPAKCRKKKRPVIEDCTISEHEEFQLMHRIKTTTVKGNLCIFEKANQEFECEDETPNVADFSTAKNRACHRIPEGISSKLILELNTNKFCKDSNVAELEKGTKKKEHGSRSPELPVCRRTQGLKQFVMSENSKVAELEEVSKRNEQCNRSPEPPTCHQPMGLNQFVLSADSQVIENHTPVEAVSSSPSPSQTEVENATNSFQSLMKEFGLNLATVTQAFLKNSGEMEATKYFLKNRVRPDGYPIWTRQDDLDLMSEDAKLRRNLINKFGSDNVAKRIAFLRS
ncbi:telomeric repeat-binding factor 2-interacting protein 1 [Ambystoma mexicanum]|uniref:telomeric repeat-binding factor 2-interacting protein 1 n=1 Tax=Ambystoma mexicanum TaxID=8296 RepID=UPI0037E7736E